MSDERAGGLVDRPADVARLRTRCERAEDAVERVLRLCKGRDTVPAADVVAALRGAA